jgi:hypothetical protein
LRQNKQKETCMSLQKQILFLAVGLLLSTSVQAEPDLTVEDDLAPSLSTYSISVSTKFDPRDRTRENGWHLARMSLAENSRPLRPRLCAPECPPGVSPERDGTAGEPTQDHAAVLQTVENKRKELEGLWHRPVRLTEAMRIMAPHIIGDRSLKRGRQEWIKDLPLRGLDAPASYPDPALWAEKHAQNYARFRAWAVQQVTVGYFPVCDGKPIAYGGQIDNPIAVSRGLCILSCGDRDTFWAQPGNGCELTDERTLAAYEAVEKAKRLRTEYLAERDELGL